MKKALSLVLSVITVISALAFTVSAADSATHMLPLYDDKTYTAGDVNEDAAFNALDAHAAKANVAGSDDEINTEAADLDADGKITSKDVVYLRSCLAGVKDISDYEGTLPIYRLSIAGNAVESYDIVVPEGADPDRDNYYVAAELLQTFIKESAGAKLSIVKGESTKTHGIYIQPLEYKGDEALSMGLKGLDDFRIICRNGDLYTYGTVRGNMYASYEIAEKYLGFTFFDHDYVYSRRFRTVDIPADTDYTVTTPMEYRHVGSNYSDTAGETFQIYYPMRLNTTLIYTGGTSRDGWQVGPHFINCHSFTYYHEAYYGQWPENTDGMTLSDQIQYKRTHCANPHNPYDWQPCASADEEFYAQYVGLLYITEMIQGWGYNHHYEEYPVEYNLYSMSWSINDNNSYCQCKTCKAKAMGTTINRPSVNMLETLKTSYTGEYTYDEANRKLSFKKEGYSGVYTDFANRAARLIEKPFECPDYVEFKEGVREYYPGMKLFTILYDKTVPETIRPDSNVIVMLCGIGCNNHTLYSRECGDDKTVLGSNSLVEYDSLREWADICHTAGTSFWYWDYGVNYTYYLAPCPNVTNFYWDYKFLHDECSIDGVIYESCGGPHLGFEDLKAYIAAKLLWNPDMSYDEFCDMVKDYMYMYYGDGYEQIYELMLMQTAAGDAVGHCFINNHDRPFDMYSRSYLIENYDAMRDLVMEAEEMADEGWQKEHCTNLRLTVEFLGLSSVYKEWYVNGTATTKAEYESRYTWFYNYITSHETEISSNPDVFGVPEELDFSVNPCIQLYITPAWRKELTFTE